MGLHDRKPAANLIQASFAEKSKVDEPMQEHRLSFGEIRIFNSRLAEVAVDEGVEISLENVAEYHEFLINQFPEQAALLINKANSYTYTFEAQRHLFLPEVVTHYAIVIYNNTGRIATESVIAMQKKNINVNIQIFEDHSGAEFRQQTARPAFIFKRD